MQDRVQANLADRYARRTPALPASQAFAAHPLAQLAAMFGLGVLAEMYFDVPLTLLILLGACATLLVVVAVLQMQLRRTYRKIKARQSNLEDQTKPKNQHSGARRLSVATFLVMLTTVLLGWTLAAVERERVPSNQLKLLLNEGTVRVGEPAEVTGVLERDPEVAPDRLYLFLRVERVRNRGVDREASGELVLLAPVSSDSIEREFAELDLRYGARLRVMTRLERADNFRNPGVSSFTEYLDRKGYDAAGFIKSPLLIERLENARVFLPLAWLYEWRRTLQAAIDSRFSKETAGVLDAAFLGNRYKLSRSTSERFREGGTFHVLVISGLHITFLGGLVFLIARRFTRDRVLQFVLSAAVLWAYSLAVGAESSVVRAALMFTVVIFAPVVSRRASSLNSLGAAALVLLAWRPGDLFDPSFQLTFVSVLAMIVLAWPMLRKFAEIGSWRPSRATPYPPSCASWLRRFWEVLFWSERKAKRELEEVNYSYKLFKTPWAATLERLHLQRLLRYAFGAIVVSACVQVALLPFLIIYFHRLSFASLVLNIGISVMMAGVALVAAVALLVGQISAMLTGPLISLADAMNWTMVHSVDPFARAGVASIRLPEYSGWGRAVYVLYYFPLGLLAVSLSRWQPLQLPETAKKKRTQRLLRIAVCAQLVVIGLIVFHPFSAGSATAKLRVDFLNVGQGDAALITFPDSTTLLVDGGGVPGAFNRNSTSGNRNNRAGFEEEEPFERETRSVGETVVSEYLWWRGLDQVDYVLATHADADHIDGLNDVVQNFKVQAALVARTPDQDPEFGQFAETLARENVPLRVIGAGDVLRFGGVNVSVLWPAPTSNSKAISANNDSIVLRLQLGERTILFTGDVESAGETGLAQARENLHADVVKVAHHGSKTSSTLPFIDAAHARFAVISVGQNSVFGHPNREVVERWKASGAQVLTTGNCGTITVTTDGQDLKVETFVRQR